MNRINEKFLNGIIGGFGLGCGTGFLLAGVYVSGVVAIVIGVVMLYDVGFRMGGNDTEAIIRAIKTQEDERQRKIAEAEQ